MRCRYWNWMRCWYWNWMRCGYWYWYRYWNWYFIMLLTDMLYYVITLMVILSLLHYSKVLEALCSGSLRTNLPRSLSGGCVTLLLYSCVTSGLDFLSVLYLFCWLADLFKNFLAEFSNSFLISSSLTTLLYVFWDLALGPVPVTVALE